MSWSRFGTNGWVIQACEDLVKKKSRTSFREGPLWQGGRVLVWRPAKAGATLDMAFDISEAGDYTLTLTCMLATSEGAFSAEVDGKPITLEGKNPLDLAIAWGTQSRLVGTGMKDLSVGRHTLRLTAATADREIGLDFFGLAHRKK